MTPKRLFAVASNGGHLIQLLRLYPVFENFDSVLVTTVRTNDTRFKESIVIDDINGNTNIFKLFYCVFKYGVVFLKKNPDLVVTTGALPGLIFLVYAKVFRKKSIWIDSIANAGELSKSGRIATKFADICITQWPDLADNDKIVYCGRVI